MYLARSTSVSQDSKSLAAHDVRGTWQSSLTFLTSTLSTFSHGPVRWGCRGVDSELETKVSRNQHSTVCTLLSLDILDVFINKFWLSAPTSLAFIRFLCVHHGT